MRELLMSDWLSYTLIGLALAGTVGFAAWYSWAHRGVDNPQKPVRSPLIDVFVILGRQEWTPYKNFRCREVTIVVDTRSKHRMCRIYDRRGNELTLEDLKSQEPQRGYE